MLCCSLREFSGGSFGLDIWPPTTSLTAHAPSWFHSLIRLRSSATRIFLALSVVSVFFLFLPFVERSLLGRASHHDGINITNIRYSSFDAIRSPSTDSSPSLISHTHPLSKA